MCCALSFPIRDKNLSDSRAASKDERKKTIFKQDRKAGTVVRSPVVSPGVSGLDAPRAGRLVGLRQRRADIVIPTTSGDYCILLHTAGYWELREVGGRDERIVKSESGRKL